MILALTGVPLVIVSILAFILVLGVIIIIHEGGHFFFARRAGILCHEFSIGMGPAIYKHKFKETTFCIRAIPIGGYVSMAGEEVSNELVKVGDTIGVNLLDQKISEIITVEDVDAMVRGEVVDVDLYGEEGNPLYITIYDGFQNQYYEVVEDAYYILKKGEKMQITPYNRSFESKSILQRFLTLFAGPFMNFILAIFLYLIVSFATGVPNNASSKIGSMPGSNSYLIQNGESILKSGDEIKKINGKDVSNWDDVSIALDDLLDTNQTNVEMEILRNGVQHTIYVNCYTYIASLGISDIQVEEKEKPNGIQGVTLGNIALRYLDDGKKGKYPIKEGDILTKIKVDKVNKDKTIEPGEVVPIESWSQLIGIFKNADVVNVKFEYYSYDKGDLVSIEECATLQTYGDEVLNNQRIEKIQIRVGMSPTMHFKFFECIGEAFKDFWQDFTLIFRTLALLIAPTKGIRQVGVNDLSSFVGIFGLIQTFVASGILSLMAFMAMLSVNIGVMNLLPIPALDGGRIVFLGYELVTRKKASKKVENIINNVFFILLMILFVYVTYHDIVRLIRK